MQIEDVNMFLKALIDGTVSLDYYQIMNLPPVLRYYLQLINEAFNRELKEYVSEEIDIRIPVRFEDVERMKVETIPHGNCYSEVLGRHRYGHVIIPRIVCDEDECVDLRKVKVVDVEGKSVEVELPEITFYVRQPQTEVVGGGKEGERKRIKNKYGRLKVVLTFWVNGAKFHVKILDVYVVLRGHALVRRKDRLFIKKTRSGKVKVVEQRAREALFLEVYIVRTLKLRKDEAKKGLRWNEVIGEEDGDFVKIYRFWRFYNRVYRKKNGKERRVLKVFLKRPERKKRIEFGNQAFWVEHKGKKFKYILKNLAQHRGVKEFALTWDDRRLNHRIVSNKPVDVYEELITVDNKVIGKKWIIGAKENGVEIDIYNFHHMDTYSKIHVSLLFNDVLVILHRAPSP